ncbi:hypothetical protein CCACVL1_05121 [Corchorus capsularis]|uniref:Uncharacterized protein n=1 Tax=Corchorus capsularis TaxID=210143 RepID=A0A1R3JMH0_COCAP|nr:hypothetical protein CCACVL1_05121 [Corchorus capsularis]
MAFYVHSLYDLAMSKTNSRWQPLMEE